jgi:uncharacterized protein YcbX
MAGGPVVATYLFPVKGARGTRTDALIVDATHGIRGDRRLGIKRRADQPDLWAPKRDFRVGANTPAMAAQTPSFGVPDGALDPSWLQQMAELLDETEVAVLDTAGRYSLVDTDPFKYGPTISFLNLASLRALEAETSWRIDPARFRMNVWYDDGQPFSELAKADSFPGRAELQIGSLRLRLLDACERCPAIEANPATGLRDLALLDALDAVLRRRGYRGSPHRNVFRVMGFLATPLGAARIEPGQEMIWLASD